MLQTNAVFMKQHAALQSEYRSQLMKSDATHTQGKLAFSVIKAGILYYFLYCLDLVFTQLYTCVNWSARLPEQFAPVSPGLMACLLSTAL